jgi:hypothetical protein
MILLQRAIGLFPSFESTELALHALQNNGFLMSRVSVVGRDIGSHTEVTGANTSNRLVNVGNLHTHENEAGEAAIKGAEAGGALGGLAGLLVGLGVIAIPGIGPVMLAGAAATALATVISGSVIGSAAGGLVGGLIGLGIPRERAETYSNRVSDGEYLVMVEGSEADIVLAESIFRKGGIREWYVYDLPADFVQTANPSVTHHIPI